MRKSKILIFLLLLQIARFTNGDIEARIDDLEAQVKELKEEIGALDDLEKMVKRNIADQKLDKTIASILLNEQDKAMLYWKEVIQFLDSNLQQTYLKTLIENSYLGNANNFYPLLDFLIQNQLYSGFPLLFKDMEMHGEIRTGQEIFALAYTIKSTCGTNNNLYPQMPQVVRDILAGPVILRNTENNGYILSDEGPYDCDSDRTCYTDAKNQIFMYRLRPNVISGLKTNPRALWRLVGPSPLNITELSKGFFLKNQDLFFVFHQRPPATYLRSNLTFKAYHSRDLHAQFEPALLPNSTVTDNQIRIGIRERFFKKIEYFFGDEFKKKISQLHFSRRAIFMDEIAGYVWEVIPVSTDTTDNAIIPGDKCIFTM